MPWRLHESAIEDEVLRRAAEYSPREEVSAQAFGTWKRQILEKNAGTAGPFEDLEAIRTDAGMSTSRSCQLIDMLQALAGGGPRRLPAERAVAAARAGRRP